MRKLLAGVVVVALIAWVAWSQWHGAMVDPLVRPGEFLANTSARTTGTATTLAAVNDKLAALVSALDASQASLGKQGELIAFLENEVSRLRAELAACEEQNR